ncbi:helix-turn-helix domain-containing protein [Tepidiforma sp.]|uniref:winged helix-turn-helix transcriptional regulator n=1 Tax=Tepidiforma sp. TaxID=2682230 RepID=UPI002ADD6CD1|nr:helix-turn-helix domain-containing protein [Tepidiforma sp.]
MVETDMHPAADLSPYCPAFQHTVELIGRRWTGAIIRTMLAGSVRFGAILQAVPGLSDRLLAERLRELEAEGIVTRTVYPEMPVRIEYHLTEKGRELERIVAAIDAWTARWFEGEPHAAG